MPRQRHPIRQSRRFLRSIRRPRLTPDGRDIGRQNWVQPGANQPVDGRVEDRGRAHGPYEEGAAQPRQGGGEQRRGHRPAGRRRRLRLPLRVAGTHGLPGHRTRPGCARSAKLKLSLVVTSAVPVEVRVLLPAFPAGMAQPGRGRPRSISDYCSRLSMRRSSPDRPGPGPGASKCQFESGLPSSIGGGPKAGHDAMTNDPGPHVCRRVM